MDFVQAAGGVVWRRGADGTVEVLLVRRPFDEDWTLPRRRVAAGEREADAALRGVEEDTGVLCELGPSLRTIAYTGRSGRPKLVRYFAMEPVDGIVDPGGAAVDEAAWVDATAAARVLAYPGEVGVVQALRELLLPTSLAAHA